MQSTWAETKITREYVWKCPVCGHVNTEDEDMVKDNPSYLFCEECDNDTEVYIGDSL